MLCRDCRGASGTTFTVGSWWMAFATGLRPGEAEADVYSKPIALISTIIGIGMAFACGALTWCAVRVARRKKKT